MYFKSVQVFDKSGWILFLGGKKKHYMHTIWNSFPNVSVVLNPFERSSSFVRLDKYTHTYSTHKKLGYLLLYHNFFFFFLSFQVNICLSSTADYIDILVLCHLHNTTFYVPLYVTYVTYTIFKLIVYRAK